MSDCLNSLLAQDIPKEEYEIICVDDGSTDNSAKILNDYAKKHRNLKVFHKENEGVSAARNYGLNIAKGEFVHFVDSDDYFYPYVYGQLLYIMKKENADIIFFDLQSVLADDVSKDCVLPHLLLEDKVKYHTNIQISANVTRNIIKRCLIEDNAIRFLEGVCYGEDVFFEDMLALYAGKKLRLEEKLYFYRAGTGVSIRMDEQSVLQRAQDCHRVAIELRELKKHTKDKQCLMYLERRISENVASVLLSALRCSKGIAYQKKKELIKDGLFPYSIRPLVKELKKCKGNIFLILPRFKLFFWLFDKLNIYRE